MNFQPGLKFKVTGGELFGGGEVMGASEKKRCAIDEAFVESTGGHRAVFLRDYV
jgi:hypothetical protein